MMAGTTGLLLVEPATFGFNVETATTNRFQQQVDQPPDAIAAEARREFSALTQALRTAGVPAAVATDSATPAKPDAVFPNNWVSFHEDGTVVLYPMRDPTRRAERREVVIDAAKTQLGYRETRRIDLSGEEARGRYLEGTGSLVLDRRARVAYACRSPRTDEALVREWSRLLGYQPYLFDAADPDGASVYHTNVLLWLGERIAGIGLDWVHESQRAALAGQLRASGRELLLLDSAQLRSFAGNMLELPAAPGLQLLGSAAAFDSLHASQRAQLAACGCTPLIAGVPLIERIGGGSVRCMVAEVPLAAWSTH
jgi:hypothetical protein